MARVPDSLHQSLSNHCHDCIANLNAMASHNCPVTRLNAHHILSIYNLVMFGPSLFNYILVLPQSTICQKSHKLLFPCLQSASLNRSTTKILFEYRKHVNIIVGPDQSPSTQRLDSGFSLHRLNPCPPLPFASVKFIMLHSGSMSPMDGVTVLAVRRFRLRCLRTPQNPDYSGCGHSHDAVVQIPS